MNHALRQLAKNPGFTIVALLTLALGIGINTTAFTVLNRLLLQSLPFHAPSELVQVWANTPRDGNFAVAPGDYFDFRDQNSVFTGVAAYQPWRTMSYAEIGKAPIQVGTIIMTDNFFPVLGIQPELGRIPSAEESKRNAFVTLISDAFWREHFNADPNVLGRTVRLNSRDSIVIGVMPPSLDDPGLFDNRPGFFYLDPVTQSRAVRNVGWKAVVARLKPGISLQQAQEDMNVVTARLAHDYPQTNKGRGAKVIPYPTNQLGDDGAQLTWMTLALSALVLLIACINLANLQLVRTTRRGQEIAIRLSLGCPRRRVVGMLLLESVLLALAGGVLGIGVAVWSNAFVAHFFDIPMPLNLRVVGFTLLVSLATGVLFGTFPAWLASRTNLAAALKAGTRGSTSDRTRHWLRQGLVVIELAMALTLLAGAGFFVSGLYRLTHRSLGWDATHEVLASLSLDQDHYGGDKNRGKVLAFGEQAVEKLAALPGATAATVSSGSPSWGSRMEAFRIEGQPPAEKGEAPQAGYFSVGPGWFEVYGIHLVQGREFTAADRADAAPVAVVDESLAHKYWPGESAVGKRIALVDPNDEKTPPVWSEVVGVMRDFKGAGEFYNPNMNSLRFIRPWAQDHNGVNGITLTVRTAGPAGPMKEAVRKALGQMLPDLALEYLATIDEDTAGLYAYFNFLRRILLQIACLGLLLAAIGIYGVVANLATERTKEVGIRMALGAQPAGIVWLFVRNGLVLAVTGAVLGLAAAYLLVAMLGRILPALPGKDPLAILGAAGLLVLVALFACWLPARRTTRINPTVALRAE